MYRIVAAACWAAVCWFALSPKVASGEEDGVNACPQQDGRPVVREDFHLYLLIGQSNMAGRGKMSKDDRRPVEGVYSLDAKGTWRPAAHPLHFDKPRVAGVGLGLDFALAMRRAESGKRDVTIGLIPCAFGGTRLDQWNRGDDLYEKAMERVRIATRCGILKGVLWHQGEGDSTEKLAPTYGARLVKMFRSLRDDLEDENLPIVVGEVGRFRIPAQTSLINAQLNETAKRLPRVGCASSDGLEHNGDSTHFDAPSLKKFGRRYAEQMLECQRQSADATGEPAGK